MLPVPTVLVVGSGGAKGLGILGALDYYFNHNLMTEINEYWGTSIGSVISFLLLIGYTPYEIFYQFFVTDQIATGFNCDVESIMSDFGLCPIEMFSDKLKDFAKEKLGTKTSLITFKELYSLFPKKLNIIGTNIDTTEAIIFNVDTYPDTPVFEAIEVSSNIPFLFTRKIFNSHQCTDGALVNAFPIDLVDNSKSILGICVKPGVEPSNHWLYKLFNIQSIELHRRTLNSFYSENSRILQLELPRITTLTPSKREKVELFTMGYSQAEKLELTTTVSTTDGWDIDFEI